MLHRAATQPVRTAPVVWVPRLGVIGSLFNRVCAKFLPKLRFSHSFIRLGGPLAAECPQALVVHGKELKPDEFSYMEDLFDRRTLNYVKQEQLHYTRYVDYSNLISTKYKTWGEVDTKVVVTSREGGFDKGEEKIGEYIYFTRTIGQGHEVGFFRKLPGQVDLLAEELINPEKLREHFGYSDCSIGVCRVSSDGQYLGYTASVEGGDRYICHVRSIGSAAVFHTIRSSNIANIEFGSGNYFFYTECNKLNRPYKVMMQAIQPGLLPPPVEIYHEDDERYFVDVRKTKDGEYIVLSSDASLKSRISLLPASFPAIPRQLLPFFQSRKPLRVANDNSWSWVEHHGGHFIIVTSHNAPNCKVCYAREELVLTGGEHFDGWQTLVAEQPGARIADLDLFKTHLVLFEQLQSFERLTQIRVISLEKGLPKSKNRSNDTILHFPPLAQVAPGLNKNWLQDCLSFMYSTVVTPPRDCVFNFSSCAELNVEKSLVTASSSLYTQLQHETLSPWDYMWEYTSYRDIVTGHDGVEIPVTIFHRRDLFVEEVTDLDPLANTPKHCLVYVYGAYGEVPSFHFQVAPYMFLIRRRWTIAFAHVRGGGEFAGWAEMGKGKTKINSTLDLVAVIEHLHREGYATPDKTVLLGNSAGCVPIAAAANMRGTTLFHCALMRSPFLDVASTMSDPELPLTLAERDDWGDPQSNPEDLETIIKYDPYYNINDQVTYPAMLISACLDDDRVPAWNALKYVARLRKQRAKKKADPLRLPLVLRLLNSGGHSPWTELTPMCEELSFLLCLFDLHGPGSKVDDVDVMQQLENFFHVGLMDHDDKMKVHLKWESWEQEKKDFTIRLVEQKFHPMTRELTRKKKYYHWSSEPFAPLTKEDLEEELQEQERRKKQWEALRRDQEAVQASKRQTKEREKRSDPDNEFVKQQ